MQREAPRKTPRLREIAAMRNHLHSTIEDCRNPSAQRLRNQIEQASTPQELWLLRNDAFALISRQHSQAVAAQRIEALTHQFEGWIDPKALARAR